MIKVDNISKSFGELSVLKNLSVEFDSKEICCILGPSGSGKTTLLTIIAGLDKADSGRVEFTEGEIPGFVFQDPVLLPWKTVLENVVFAIKKIFPYQKAVEKAMNYLELVRLGGYHHYYPHQLSEGMKQRVAIARGLSFPADLLLMDEPFNKLDIKLKDEVMCSVRDETQKKASGLIYVTHNPDEAMAISDRIIVFPERPLSDYRLFELSALKSANEIEKIRKDIISALKEG